MAFSYYAAVALLSLLPVGYVTEGLPLKDGRRLKYRCNGTCVQVSNRISLSSETKLVTNLNATDWFQTFDELFSTNTVQLLCLLWFSLLNLIGFYCNKYIPVHSEL